MPVLLNTNECKLTFSFPHKATLDKKGNAIQGTTLCNDAISIFPGLNHVEASVIERLKTSQAFKECLKAANEYGNGKGLYLNDQIQIARHNKMAAMSMQDPKNADEAERIRLKTELAGTRDELKELKELVKKQLGKGNKSDDNRNTVQGTVSWI